jgi:beta-galactosidase
VSPALLILLGRSALAQEGDAAPEVTSGETIEPAEAAPVAEEPVAAPPRPPRAPDEPNTVTIHHDADGYTLLVDGEVTMVRGMNWGYMPIGQNYSYDFWGQPDDFIEAALRTEMGLLAAMGVNSIRQYPVIPPRWVRWIYDNYGITTMINPLVGRYGTTMAGRWIPVVDYSDPATRAHLKAETLAAVELYRDTPGVLLWLLGNENNYGLHWSSFEIEALPEDARDDARAVHLYSLYGEIIDAIHARDDRHPVSIANGDLQYIDVLAEHAGNLDIMGSNVYRGISSRDLFAEVEEKLGVPFLYTEFGADAYNARRGAEDHLTQARYLVGQWGEIYRKSAGKGEEGNAIGGYTFQWSDGWWKYLQETELDVHNTNASWPNAGYAEDYVEGANNMNEEWFGICAKGPPDASGLYEVYPRAAYYALQAAYTLDPYAPTTTLAVIDQHFGQIQPVAWDATYRASSAAGTTAMLKRARVSNVRLDMWTTAANPYTDEQLSITHTESVYVDFAVEPTDRIRGEVSINALADVGDNRIDTIFYEGRGRSTDDTIDPTVLERVRLYRAGLTWEDDRFVLDGFYRRGHYHWGYDGDFFGLYREANYGPNIDIYDANVPIGLELTGRGALDGLTLAAGPELYWGANPSAFARYRQPVGPAMLTLIHQEEVASQQAADSSLAIPEQAIRRSTVHLQLRRGGLGLDIGGIFAGSNKIGQEFVSVTEASGESYGDSGYHVLTDEIILADTLGGKAKFTLQAGPVSWYVQGSYKGLVADGGPDQTQTFTGWTLKESGRGNHYGGLSGVAVNLGSFQLAPNFLYQKPIVGPLPVISDAFDAETGWYLGSVTPRNVVDDPFAVLDNRETIGLELMLAWDTTPGTWMWMWDNDVREDAPIAASLDFAYRIQPTSRDSTLGFSAEGVMFTFDAAPPAQNVWDLTGRAILNPRGDLRILTRAYLGQAQARGSDPRLVTRYGGDMRVWWRNASWESAVKIDDWGPYDYHRDYNLTFPLQLLSDLSLGIKPPRLVGGDTRLGIRGKLRYLDEYSPDRIGVSGDWGNEYEVESYVRISL